MLNKKDITFYCHCAIGLAIMFGLPLLPPSTPITPVGMQVLGVFIGAVYLWSTVDNIWPSLLGLVVIGISDYTTVAKAFAAIMLLFAGIVTNFAINAVLGTVLMPVLVAFAAAEGFNPVPIAMMTTLVCFLAILTPAASPYAAVLHANKEWVTFKEIITYTLPITIIGILAYIFIGYPLGQVLFPM